MAVPVADVGRSPAAVPQIDAGREGGTGTDLDSVHIAEGGGACDRGRRRLVVIFNSVFPVVVGQHHDAGISACGSLRRPVPRSAPEVGCRLVLVKSNAVGGIMGMAVSLRKSPVVERRRRRTVQDAFRIVPWRAAFFREIDETGSGKISHLYQREIPLGFPGVVPDDIEAAVIIDISETGHAELFLIGFAPGVMGGLPRLRQCRQEKRRQNRDDRDHHYDHLLNIQYGVY